MTGYTDDAGWAIGLSTDLVLSLCEDQDGSILLGADYEGGTFRFKEGKFTRFWSREEALTNRVIRVIYRDREGELWFGSSSGLVRSSTREKFLEQATIRCVAQDRAGDLWVGTSEGLFLRKGGGFERYKLLETLSGRTVLALYEDRDQNLWLSLEGAGLGRFRKGEFTLYTPQQGLWSNEIFEILEDDHGWLWMSCPKGVFRVNRKNLDEVDGKQSSVIACIAYGKADGMESIQCSGVAKPAGWKSHDGRLWFATTKGLVVTDPNSGLGMNDRPPPVRIEQILADKRPLGLTGSMPPRVEPGRGELEFHFTALSYQVPEKNRFKYKLAGVDPEWVEAGPRRVAYYNNLRPGQYRFEVKACNNDGVWNEAVTEANIVVLPHFWQAWWFTPFASIVMAGMIGTSVRYATRRKLQQKLERLEQKNAIEKERTRIARDMHDDLGAQLTEILLLNELARKNMGSADNLEGYLGKQMHVVQDVAGSLGAIVWAINPINDTVDRLANYLYEQAERLLTMRSISCRFDVPDQLSDGPVSSEIRHNVFLAVREGLNNIIKHSGASEVWFRVRATQASLTIVIEDNGRGFSSAERSAFGNGLRNMERRMKNVGGTFRLATRLGEGTRIRLEVPLKTESIK